MASPTFVEMASALVEAMGQRLEAAKPIPEGLALRTEDGFLYAFFEDPNEVSLDSIRRLAGDEAALPPHLVVLTPGRLPLALGAEVVRRGGTLVEASRFHELVRQLGLGTYLGDEPRALPDRERRLLPSAEQLDLVMTRARTWLDWGVPALALRFYRQAAALKPEFAPARVGIGRSLLALGLVTDADTAFDVVLAAHPDDLEARLGKAAAAGAQARPDDEIAMYRALLEEDQARLEVRAHLVAALIDRGDWAGARVEIQALLARTPEDAQLRFLHGVTLERTGEPKEGARERTEARALGLPYEREVALCQHLGLPVLPAPPTPSASPGSGTPADRAAPRRTTPPPAPPDAEGVSPVRRRAASAGRSRRAGAPTKPRAASRAPRKHK